MPAKGQKADIQERTVQTERPPRSGLAKIRSVIACSPTEKTLGDKKGPQCGRGRIRIRIHHTRQTPTNGGRPESLGALLLTLRPSGIRVCSKLTTLKTS